ncbi:hypothetical protein [Bradyrhizobium sp.]|uniref:hypothetical protein n=1 Tax=Bradyrhizobium sp. TaxID=376 RepID=UPI0026309FEC|nr:hypothetical protein [Bradyrhizobium sp.]
MIGGTLSKWTMSYFAIAITWLIAAEALMAAGFGFPAADVAAADTLVIVHMVCIGWLSMAMCGALFQFVPVLVGKPLFDERWELPALVLLTAGLTALLAGFLVLGGRLPAGLWLLPLAATLLAAGFALVVADLGLTVWRARPPVGPAHFVLAGLVSLCATVALGTGFAWSLSGHGGEELGKVLATGVPLHAIAGLGGWLTLTAMGVSYRLLSMFMLAPDVDGKKSRLTLAAGSAAIGVAVAGGLFAIEAEAGLGIVLAAAAAFGLATFALYGRDVAALYRNRKRRQLELNTKMAAYGFASLAAAALLGIALVATGSFAAHVGAFAFLVAFGWLSGLVLAKLYKIVAFLTWLETYGPAMGRLPTPRVQDLVAEGRASKWFAVYFVSVWGGTASLLFGQASVFRGAAAVMTLATAGIVQELIRTRRLADVAEPLRLPNGTQPPCLLYSRT